MLKLKNISKTYLSQRKVETKALKNVNIHIKHGDFISILGPSGSGKTTLLNVIGGLDRFDEGGEFIIDGVSSKKFKDKD